MVVRNCREHLSSDTVIGDSSIFAAAFTNPDVSDLDQVSHFMNLHFGREKKLTNFLSLDNGHNFIQRLKIKSF
jgi:hypothetical protein